MVRLPERRVTAAQFQSGPSFLYSGDYRMTAAIRMKRANIPVVSGILFVKSYPVCPFIFDGPHSLELFNKESNVGDQDVMIHP